MACFYSIIFKLAKRIIAIISKVKIQFEIRTLGAFTPIHKLSLSIINNTYIFQLSMVLNMDDLEVDCSIIYSLEALGKKWNVFIIASLINNNRLSFTELREELMGNYQTTISSRVLTDKLNKLTSIGIILRTEESGNVYYSLTEKGKDFKIVFIALKSWAIKHGGLSYEKCANKTCIHKIIEFIEFDSLVEKMK